MRRAILFFLLSWAIMPALATAADTGNEDFPAKLVDFAPYAKNPVFAGTGRDAWDRQIRERGYILKEGSLWRLWYTGYNSHANDAHYSDMRYLGYATSNDGITWTRCGDKPLLDNVWVEDLHIARLPDCSYRMFAEGRDDIMHWLTSPDGLRWQDRGRVDIRHVDGSPIAPGPYGTPTAWNENGKWYLFYERQDLGIWLAASTDGKTWTNVQEEPVIPIGVEPYDKYAIALNQIIKVDGKYYAYYHGNADRRFKAPWTTNVAMSRDLIHWKKYPGNPIIPTEHSSAVLVNDGRQYRMYTMHPEVWAWFPRTSAGAAPAAAKKSPATP